MTKPDRFERIAKKPASWHARQTYPSIQEWAASLLRNEHAATVRAVKKMPRYDVVEDCGEDTASLGLYADGEFVKRSDLLAYLNARKA